MKWVALIISALAAYIAIPESAEAAAPTCSCPAGSECPLVLAPPYDAEQSILVASNSLTIGAGTTVTAGPSADGAVANLGYARTTIGAGASVGGVFSNANVTLGAAASVNGPLKTAGTLTAGSGATITGLVSTSAPIHPDPKLLATVTFTAVAPAVTVANGAIRHLDPGDYGATLVGAGGTLSLSAGTYYLASLIVGHNATLALDETSGPVIIYVQTKFSFDGIESETGSEGHVLVAAFGCGTDAVTAAFRGTILAPSASLLLGPDGVQSFSGKFVAETITVGANNSVIGLEITVPTAPPSLISAHVPPPLPAPPATSETGCFQYTPNGWQGTPCATDDFIDSHFPHPDAQLTVTSSAGPPLVYGQLAATILNVASEQDALGGNTVPNAFSIQNNTNQWTVPKTAGSGAGDSAAAQFTIQSNGSTTAICIWQVDVTKQQYPKTCVSASQQRAGGLQPSDFGNLAASITADGKLALVAQLSWVPPGQPNIYAVKPPANDMFGLAGNWTQVSGGLLGLGNGSQAQLTNAQAVTEIAASTCPGDTGATSPTCPPPTLQPNASAFIGGTGTVETSNLQSCGTPAVTFPNADLAVSSLISQVGNGSCTPTTAAITYHQVGACNGFIANPGPPTELESAGVNQAFVVFAIERIDNSLSNIGFNFDPGNLYVQQAQKDFFLPLSDQIYKVILGPFSAVPTALSPGQNLGFSVGAFGALIVATANSNGAVEANQTPYFLQYNKQPADPQISLVKSDAFRTSWPLTEDCSTIQLQ
jgi:hypothetical protein